jgi:hypothetical protein
LVDPQHCGRKEGRKGVRERKREGRESREKKNLKKKQENYFVKCKTFLQILFNKASENKPFNML